MHYLPRAIALTDKISQLNISLGKTASRHNYVRDLKCRLVADIRRSSKAIWLSTLRTVAIVRGNCRAATVGIAASAKLGRTDGLKCVRMLNCCLYAKRNGWMHDALQSSRRHR